MGIAGPLSSIRRVLQGRGKNNQREATIRRETAQKFKSEGIKEEERWSPTVPLFLLGRVGWKCGKGVIGRS